MNQSEDLITTWYVILIRRLLNGPTKLYLPDWLYIVEFGQIHKN